MRRAVSATVASDRLLRLLVWLSFLLPALLFLGCAWFDREQLRHSEERSVTATADTLAEHAQAVMDTSAIALALVRDRTAGVPWDQIHSSVQVHEFLKSLIARLPQIESLFLVDPQGRETATSRVFPVPVYDLSSRDYYQAAQKGGDQVFVSLPFHGLIRGTYDFVVTRPTPDHGLVGATISSEYFENFYRSVLGDTDFAAATLFRDDGALLLRFPPLASSSPRPTSDAYLRRLLQTRGAATELTSPYDGVSRISALRQLHGFPVVIGYGRGVSAYLGIWYRHLAVMAGFAAVMSGLLAVAAREALRRSRAERARLQQLLVETERREQLEAALRQSQKMEALGRLTGGVAHDFNNLLTAVMGGLELAMRRTEDAYMRRLLEGAMQAARRGAQLTKQMLALSRHEPLTMQAVNVGPLLSNLREMLLRTLGPTVVIREAVEPGLRPVRADPTQLEVAVLNLGINARDAMPQGGTLILSAAAVPDGAPRPPELPDGHFVVLRVADTGSGMSEEVRRRAIEPFFTTKEIGRGTGLGLSMVDGLVRQAGGAMTIESELGRGTTISLFLPVASPVVAGAETAKAATIRQPQLSVLLVDDDPEVRRSTAMVLADLGHKVTEAEGGEAALAAAQGARPDIVLLDFAMPEMDGGALARALAARYPTLPLLMMTGYVGTADGSRLPQHTRVLSKPFGLAELASALMGAIDAVADRPPESDVSPP